MARAAAGIIEPTTTVSFRFLGQLNDFLAPGRRWRTFAHSLRGPASVKDAIEGLGVPHPEVDILLVNGEAARFPRVLRDGDAVTVYPFTPSLRASGVVRAGGDPPRPIRFVADIHLVKLAAWLRLAGFDTAVEADDERLAMMAGEDRVALTRDVGVLKRAAVRYGRWVHATDPERQFGEVIARYDLAAGMAPFTRCLRCNAALQPADAAAVADRLPPRVRATFREFSRCPACGRIYWRGTHYAKLAALLQRARTGM